MLVGLGILGEEQWKRRWSNRVVLFIYSSLTTLSPGARPTLIITEIVITKSIKNEGWNWGGKGLGERRGMG